MRPTASAWLCVFALGGVVPAALGCGGSDTNATTRRPTVTKPPRRDVGGPSAPELLPAQVIGRLEDEGSPWHFARARAGGGGLALWVAKGRWWARFVGDDGTATAAAVDVGAAGATTASTLAAVADGWIASWVEPVARNHTVRALSIDTQGRPRGEAAVITQVPDELTWVEVLPNAKGALLVWEIAREQRSDVFAVPLAGGKSSGSPVAVARGTLGWQAAATDRGAAVALVMPAPGKEAPAAGARSPLGRVELLEIDVAAKLSAPVVVHNELTAQIDIEVSEVGGGYLLAWTDERDIDASVQLAVVSGGRVTVPARRATAPSGEQALVGLFRGADGKRALLAWEELLHARRDGRVVNLAHVDGAGAVAEGRARMLFSTSGRPDLVADGDGFAAVTLAPAMLSAGQPPAEPPLWPTFVRFGSDLGVRASEPLRAAPFAATESVPDQTRYLSCGAKGTCSTLATGAGAGAPLAVIGLPIRKSAWRAPAWRDVQEAPPRAASLVALVDGEPLADVAAVGAPDQSSQLCAWVTYFLEGAKTGLPKGKKPEEPQLATLGVRPITGAVPGKANVISRRAVSVGGVALSPPVGAKRESVVAWVAKERNEPQVFLTKVGPDGVKLAQKALTVVPRRPRDGVPNEVYDVAVASSGEGADAEWTVAWIDTRDGDAEVYVARVDKDLKKTGPDRRITEARGDASEVQLLVAGNDTFVAWSDARADADGGAGDVYLAKLETRTLKKQAEETRLFASAGHSRSPRFATGGLLAVSWIEDGATASASARPAKKGQPRVAAGGGREDAGAMVAQLDPKGATIGAPVLLRGDRGAPVTSAALACPAPAANARPVCRVAMTSASGESLQLSAMELSFGAASPAPPKTLATLTGGAAQDAAPAFADPTGQQLFFADDAAGGSGRLRWMTIGWR
jgi:hypothetical protein